MNRDHNDAWVWYVCYRIQQRDGARPLDGALHPAQEPHPCETRPLHALLGVC